MPVNLREGSQTWPERTEGTHQPLRSAEGAKKSQKRGEDKGGIVKIRRVCEFQRRGKIYEFLQCPPRKMTRNKDRKSERKGNPITQGVGEKKSNTRREDQIRPWLKRNLQIRKKGRGQKIEDDQVVRYKRRGEGGGHNGQPSEYDC